MRRGAHIGAIALGGCSPAGCTTGNRWVDAPENGAACTAEFCNDGEPDTWVAVVDSETDNPGAHERRNRVISLGAVFDDRDSAAAPAHGADLSTDFGRLVVMRRETSRA